MRKEEKIEIMINKLQLIKIGLFISLFLGVIACKSPEVALKEPTLKLPDNYNKSYLTDSSTIATIEWRDYFKDENLHMLIDSALAHNQELNIVLQEMEIGKNEVLEKQGEYSPFVNLGVGVGTEKAARYTRDGAVEENLKITEDEAFPEPLPNLQLEAVASWEVDIWHKLHNAKDAAQMRYMAQTEGRNFLITQLIAEIADSYFELEALDNLLFTIDKNVKIQQDALDKMQTLKDYGEANQLAVNRFKAQLINSKNEKFAIQQKITETENKLHVLVGDFGGSIPRNSLGMMESEIQNLQAGVPAQLLENRPDIRKAEWELKAAELDVQVAKADFYPKLEIKAGVGFQAFNPKYFFKPESLLYDAAGELMAPLINKKAINARYNMANAQQIQAVYQYEQSLLNAQTDVLNQLAKSKNFSDSFTAKSQEVQTLNQSVDFANDLFKYGRADYVEVLLTQEELLDAQMELVEIKLKQ